MNQNKSKQFVNNSRAIEARINKRRDQLVRAAKKPAKTFAKRASAFDLNGAFSDIISSVTSSISKPAVLLVSLAVTAVIVTSSTIFTTGFIGTWMTANAENAVAIWIKANQAKFLGLIIAIPPVMAAPKNLQVFLALASFFWVMIVPESTVYQYLFQSLALHTYFRVKHPDSRIIIIIAVALAYYLGWVVLTPTVTPSDG